MKASARQMLWCDLSSDAPALFRNALLAIFRNVAHPERLNEAETEDRIIRPILRALGWDGCYWVQLHALAAEQRFLHWQIAFPGVWKNWASTEPQGGFDAVIGNPPWDRLKMQEVE
jgi:hypothetical protein